MTTFWWMSSMSYNIMKQFGGNARLNTKHTEKKALVRYALYSFGLSVLMTTIVYLTHYFDRSKDVLKGTFEYTALFSVRPGFGEETCWFTTCNSKGAAVFLYG